MPEKETLRRARRDKAEGKSPTTQAGEFVREEIHHIREGKHGARSPEQAIAIGLSKARRAGVRVPRPRGKSARKRTTTSRRRAKRPSVKRARAVRRALKRAPRKSASRAALSRHARKVARQRPASARKAAARKAARTRKRARAPS
jgi:uncharacterized protein DUF6496